VDLETEVKKYGLKRDQTIVLLKEILKDMHEGGFTEEEEKDFNDDVDEVFEESITSLNEGLDEEEITKIDTLTERAQTDPKALDELLQMINPKGETFKKDKSFVSPDPWVRMVNNQFGDPNYALARLPQDDLVEALRDDLTKHGLTLSHKDPMDKEQIHLIKRPMNVSEEFPVNFVTTDKPLLAMGRTKPGNKVRMQVKVSALNLPMQVQERLLGLVGPRYDRTNDALTIVVDKFNTKISNIVQVRRIFQELLAEAWKADPNYVPVEELKQTFNVDPGHYVFFTNKQQ